MVDAKLAPSPRREAHAGNRIRHRSTPSRRTFHRIILGKFARTFLTNHRSANASIYRHIALVKTFQTTNDHMHPFQLTLEHDFRVG